MQTCSRAAIFLAQVVSAHCLSTSAFSHALRTVPPLAPCGNFMTNFVRCNCLNGIDLRLTPLHGPSTRAYDNTSKTVRPDFYECFPSITITSEPSRTRPTLLYCNMQTLKVIHTQIDELEWLFCVNNSV